jgi:hypothetical protein
MIDTHSGFKVADFTLERADCPANSNMQYGSLNPFQSQAIMLRADFKCTKSTSPNCTASSEDCRFNIDITPGRACPASEIELQSWSGGGRAAD